MKKGFTLIELLATIVIIAIILLIVTPMLIKNHEYNKIVCDIDGKVKEIHIDEIIQNTDTTISFKSDGKKYEFSKNVCYLVKE